MQKKTAQKQSKRIYTYFGVIGIFLLLGAVAGVLSMLPGSNPVMPPEFVKYANDWPVPNQNLANTREAVKSSISSENISKLGIAWSLPIKGVSEWGAAATNPLIMGNTVYFQDLKSNVYAVDFTTGKQLAYKEYNLDNAGPNGVAVGYGNIYVVKGRNTVVSLDMAGKELWSTKLTENPNEGIDIQPVVYGNLVYVSTVPGVSNENFYRGGAVGIIYALDQLTGKVVWSFNTVDSADIWGNKNVNSGGGAWYPPAIDITTDKLYWPIGNPAPWPGTKDFPNGSSRPGKNLYTNSLVTLNRTDGKLDWYNQVLEHDLFDYDFQISPMLVTTTIDNADQKLIIGAGKMGKVYAFDRLTGKTIWESSVGTHLNDTLTSLPAGETMVSPGPLGGVETPLAYSDGIVYVPVVNMTVKYTPSSFVAESFNLATGKGELVALDVRTGTILWTQKFDSINVGGATVVNDLVFTATYDGKIYAINKKSGGIVWQYQASGGINSWPAVKGNTIIFAVGVGKNPALLAFKIGGTVQQNTTTTPVVGGAGKGFEQ